MLTQDVIEKIIRFARHHKEIVAVYLFGSTATGKSRGRSDVDIAVMTREKIDGFERADMETSLSNLLGRDADLCVFAQSGPLLQHQILKYGKLLYESDPRERVKQEVFSRTAYWDTQFLYKELRDNPNG